MYELIPFLKENKNKYIWMFFIIVQQIVFLLYLNSYIFSDNAMMVGRMVWIFDLVSIIYIYVAGHIRKANDVFLKKIIVYVSLICWQHFFVLNSNHFYYNIGIMLQPLVTYIFTVGSFNLLLYEKKDFKRKFDIFIYVILLLMIPIFLINRVIFNFIYLILFIGLHLYPSLIMVIYRKYFSSILSKIRQECFIFALFLLIMLGLNFIDNFVNIGLMYSNVGWYIVTITICSITYLRLVQEVLLIKAKSFLGKITFISSMVILLSVVLWIWILYQNIKRFDYVILALVLTELFMFIIVLYIRIYLEYRSYIRPDSFESNKFISMIKIEEDAKEKFAEYLHDDILQSIIALKNIIQISRIESENKNLIVCELNNLVNNIRNEVDTQKPIINRDVNLKKVYQEMINDLSEKYKTSKKINFNCVNDINIYPPYSSIVYRVIKEIVNNAIKYSEGYTIDIYLEIRFDNIYIKTNNYTSNTKIKIGNGLDNIQRKVKFLKGRADIYIEDGIYSVELVIPMERRVCFEDIIN